PLAPVQHHDSDSKSWGDLSRRTLPECVPTCHRLIACDAFREAGAPGLGSEAATACGSYLLRCSLRITESLIGESGGASSTTFLKDAVATSCLPILSSARPRL